MMIWVAKPANAKNFADSKHGLIVTVVVIFLMWLQCWNNLADLLETVLVEKLGMFSWKHGTVCHFPLPSARH